MKVALKTFARATVLLTLVIVAESVSAQSTAGTIYGTVQDQLGAVLPNADITITDVKMNLSQTSRTNESGDYTFVAVSPSDYTVTANVSGFKSVTQTGVTVDANQNVNVSFKLTPGATSAEVEVHAGTTLVDTRESQIGTTIDEKQISDLPTINQDPYELIVTAPGVSGFNPDLVIGSRNGANFSVDGFKNTMGTFYLDGGQDNSLKTGGGDKAPTAYALQEFRLLTANYDAEFGRSPGAIVNLITKAGASARHGELHEFLRNDMFDAKNFFADPGTNETFKQNEFGGAFGGPVPRSRQTFFYTYFDHLQLHQLEYTYGSQVLLPTAAEASGDFRNSTPAITQSCNGVVGVICSSAMDPVAVAIMNYIPKINVTSGISPTQSAPANNLVNLGLLRIDFNALPHHSIEAMFFDSRGSGADPQASNTNDLLNFAGMLDSDNQINGVIADTWILSNQLVNTVRLFYTSSRFAIANMYNGRLLPDLGSVAGVGGGYAAAPPHINNPIAGPAGFNVGPLSDGPSYSSQRSFGIVDVANAMIGRHSIKFGGSFIWNDDLELGGSQSGGSFTLPGSGNPWANFLLGKTQSFTQNSGLMSPEHMYDPALFVQDNWRVLARLSLNLGIRWEMFTPYQGDGQNGTFYAGLQSKVFPTAPLGILYEGDPRVAPGVANASLLDVAPRIGFATDVSGDGRTSIRGALGIFYYQQISDNFVPRAEEPYNLTITLSGGGKASNCTAGTNGTGTFANPYEYAGVLGCKSPFPYTVSKTNPVFVPGATVYSMAPGGGATPYAYEYNLSLEQQLTANYAFRISYVGSSFIKQFIALDINEPTYDPVTGTYRRPYNPDGSGTFGQIIQLTNASNMHYNSLQAVIHGRLGKNVNADASYVWSKALDYSSPTNPLELNKAHGAADTDIRNRFALSALVPLPRLRRFGAFGKYALSGWQLSDITVIQSGGPFTIRSGTDTNQDGVNTDYPDVIAYPYTRVKGDLNKVRNYINPNAFAVPTGSDGDEQRNFLHLPMQSYSNPALLKEFPTSRENRIQVRIEAYNVFNKPNFTLTSNVLGLKALQTGETTGADQINAAQSGRQMQFAIRYIF